MHCPATIFPLCLVMGSLRNDIFGLNAFLIDNTSDFCDGATEKILITGVYLDPIRVHCKPGCYFSLALSQGLLKKWNDQCQILA